MLQEDKKNIIFKKKEGKAKEREEREREEKAKKR